jgi:hypothetical protein
MNVRDIVVVIHGVRLIAKSGITITSTSEPSTITDKTNVLRGRHRDGRGGNQRQQHDGLQAHQSQLHVQITVKVFVLSQQSFSFLEFTLLLKAIAGVHCKMINSPLMAGCHQEGIL